MTLVPFSPRSPSPTDFDVTLSKGPWTRRFWVRPARDPGAWWGQVFFGDTQHRACIAHDLMTIHRFVAECQREIAAYLDDGWIAHETPRAPRHSRKALPAASLPAAAEPE